MCSVISLLTFYNLIESTEAKTSFDIHRIIHWQSGYLTVVWKSFVLFGENKILNSTGCLAFSLY